MFWIALEMGISKMGLITKLSLSVKKLSSFLEFAKSGNAEKHDEGIPEEEDVTSKIEGTFQNCRHKNWQ